MYDIIFFLKMNTYVLSLTFSARGGEAIQGGDIGTHVLLLK